MDSIPESGRSLKWVNDNRLQYSWLENSTDRGAWRAIVHGVAKSRTRLSDFTHTHAHTHTHTEGPNIRESESRSVVSNPVDYTVYGILQARILECVAFPFSRGSSQPRDQTQVSRIAGRFPAARLPGKPKNTGVGCHFLLQGIFPTQGSNSGLPHCRQRL